MEYTSTSRGAVLVDTKQFKANIKAYQSLLKPKTKLMAIVKANAYGHGLVEMAILARATGVDAIGVATVEEAVILRENGVVCPILVLGISSESEIECILKYNLIQTVCDKDFLKALQRSAQERDQKVSVHAKINTGMNRIGFSDLEDWKSFLCLMQKCTCIDFDGVFTHFSDADGASEDYTHWQVAIFEQFLDKLSEYGYQRESMIIHACNSAATKAFPQYHYDMVRVGIGLYGYPQVLFEQIKPVLTWTTYITSIQTLPKGAEIGYGRTATLDKTSKIATISIGYGDGYHRLLSNRAQVLVDGKLRSIIGRVCMDQAMILLEYEDSFYKGQEVVLINKMLDAEQVASWAETISYETLLAISPRMPRIYLK